MRQILIDRIEKPIKIQFIGDIFKQNTQESKSDEDISKKAIVHDELKIAMNMLNIEEFDTQKIMKKKYKNLLIEYHPDKVFHESKKQIDEYTKIFQDIQSSYAVITTHYENNI